MEAARRLVRDEGVWFGGCHSEHLCCVLSTGACISACACFNSRNGQQSAHVRTGRTNRGSDFVHSAAAAAACRVGRECDQHMLGGTCASRRLHCRAIARQYSLPCRLCMQHSIACYIWGRMCAMLLRGAAGRGDGHAASCLRRGAVQARRHGSVNVQQRHGL